MLKKCKYCSAEYDGDPWSSACPACVSARKTTTLATRTCILCGVVFLGGPAAKYCPPCRAEKVRQNDREAKERARAGKNRKIGSVDICTVCGKEYIVNGGKQKYCPDCAPEAIRLMDIEASKRWNEANTTPGGRREERKAANLPIKCVICGKDFVPTNAAKTCSPECSKALKKLNAERFERKNREERKKYHKERIAAEIAKMPEEEKVARREEINERARENYKKRRAKMESLKLEEGKK